MSCGSLTQRTGAQTGQRKLRQTSPNCAKGSKPFRLIRHTNAQMYSRQRSQSVVWTESGMDERISGHIPSTTWVPFFQWIVFVAPLGVMIFTRPTVAHCSAECETIPCDNFNLR